MKKSLKVLFTLALALALCMSLGTVAFADATPVDTLTVSKDLEVADGTTVPAATFTFTLTGDAASSTGLQTNEGCPTVSSVSVTYANTDTPTNGVVTKTVDVDFTDVTFPHAGVYAYTLAETPNTYTAATGEVVTYDDTTYTVYVYVVNGTDGPEVINVELVDESDNKVDPDDASLFTNTYVKKADVLTITKTVAGDYGDRTLPFSYSLTITAAPTAEADEAFTCKLDGTDTTGGKCGTEYTFTLTHGQTLEIAGLTAGATYTLTETGTDDYLPSASVVSNNGTAVAFGSNASYGDDLEATGSIGEDTNTAAFTNTYNDDDITPTGIIINSLPFVMLIVVAAAGLFLFILSAKRRSED